jgi:hypothetical protein
MSRFIVQRGHVARSSGPTGAPGEQAMARRNAAAIVAIAKDLPDVTPVVIDAEEPTARYRGDVFAALHGDSAGNPKARGASVGYRNDVGRAFAQRWKTLYAAGGWKSGFRQDNYTTNLARYYGTGRAVSAGNAKAIIVEHGFLSNASDRAFIESEQGVRLAAAALICAAYPQHDLDTLLKRTPKIEKVSELTIAASTEPSASIITVGDTGSDVRAWQEKLGRYLPNDPDAHRPDGHFGEKTARWTARAMLKMGVVSTPPTRPLVGPLVQEAMNKALSAPSPSWKGKRVRAKVDLNFYDGPRWTEPTGIVKAGQGFPTIEALVQVGGGQQYRVRNSRGAGPFYLTAASRFVDLAP